MKFVMASMIMKDLERYIETYGDIPVVLMTNRTGNIEMSPIIGTSVLSAFSSEDENHEDTFAVFRDCDFDEDDLEKLND